MTTFPLPDLVQVPGLEMPTASICAAASLPIATRRPWNAPEWIICCFIPQSGSGTSTGGVTAPKQTWTYAADCVISDPGAPSLNTMPYRQMVATLLPAPGYTSHF